MGSPQRVGRRVTGIHVGHFHFSGAVAAIIERFYGRRRVAFGFRTDGATGGDRFYGRPNAAAREAGRSRIYRIHFQFSNEEGQRMRRLMAAEVSATRLRRKRGP